MQNTLSALTLLLTVVREHALLKKGEGRFAFEISARHRIKLTPTEAPRLMVDGEEGERLSPPSRSFESPTAPFLTSVRGSQVIARDAPKGVGTRRLADPRADRRAAKRWLFDVSSVFQGRHD